MTAELHQTTIDELPTTPDATSRSAAEVAGKSSSSDRAKLYRWLLEFGPHTDEEAEHGMDLPRSARVRTRRKELVERGLARKTTEFRLTRSGCFAVVWEAIPHANAEAILRRKRTREEGGEREDRLVQTRRKLTRLLRSARDAVELLPAFPAQARRVLVDAVAQFEIRPSAAKTEAEPES